MAAPAPFDHYSEGLLTWVQSKLNSLIGADDFAPLMLGLRDSELLEYCFNLLGDNPATNDFVSTLISKRNQERSRGKAEPRNSSRKQSTHSRKAGKGQKAGKGPKTDPKRDKKGTMTLNADLFGPTTKKRRVMNPSPAPTNIIKSVNRGGSMTITHAPITKKGARSKKKKKRTRQVCGCQATLHEVFKNCTECGNILCVLEGEGPCFYCSAFVTLAGTISADSAIAQQPESESYKKAVAQKEKLLKFGREKIAQVISTTIIDDQGDFYMDSANNLWLTQKEREIAAAKAKEQESKLNESRADKAIEISLCIDERGGVSIDEIEDTRKKYVFEAIDREKELKERMERERRKRLEEEKTSATTQSQNSWYHNSSLTGHASQVYASIQKMMDCEKKKIEESQQKKKNSAAEALHKKFEDEANSGDDKNDDESGDGVQKDVDFLSRKKKSKNVRRKMKRKTKYSDKTDDGVCLSMHQPWASLLVLGIKQVEGRSWRTQFRGRLWIASARREPTPFEIDEVEQQYCKVYGLTRDQIPFPKTYPCTALLGCVDMVDCLTNEEYVEQYVATGLSNEMNGSPHCFMCQNPRRLILPGAISGEHKLWKMPQERIKPMQSGLIPCDLSWIPTVEEEEVKRQQKVMAEDEAGDLQYAIAESLNPNEREPVRVICISDTHNGHKALTKELEGLYRSKEDILIHCGDMTEKGRKVELSNIDSWFGRLPFRKERTIVISGNMDGIGLEKKVNGKEIFENAVYLQHETYVVPDSGDLKVFGCPYTPKFVGGFQLKTQTEEKRIFEEIPNDTDILIVHGPPYGILDTTSRGQKVGSRALLHKVLKEAKPKAVVFGHVHESGPQKVVENDIIFVNAAMYNPIHLKQKQDIVVFEV